MLIYEELERLRRRRMVELMRRMQAKEAKGGREEKDPRRVLCLVLVGRAWEVLDAAEQQYPKITRRLEAGLAHLVSTGRLKGPITGGQLLWFFRRLRMNVRLETRIRVLEHGELKTIGERLRESPR